MKRGELYRFINDTLNNEELAELCLALDIDIENLGGDTRRNRAFNLEGYLTRRGRLEEAVPAMAELFPDLDLTPLGGPPPRRAASAEPLSSSAPTPASTTSPVTAAPRVERFPYENFDIHVRAAGTAQYSVEVTNSPDGQSESVTQALPLDDAQGTAWVEALRDGPLDGEQAEAMGRALYAWLFPPPVAERFSGARAKSRYLRIRLRLDPPEISRLPWEFAFHPGLGHLALNRELPIVRYLAEPFAPQLDRSAGAARLLVAGASPQDHPPLDVEKEMESLATTLEPLREKIALRRLSNATFSSLHDALIEGADIFHFIGHGDQRVAPSGTPISLLVLEGEDGEPSQSLTAQMLRPLLVGRNIKLVMLNACNSAQSGAAEAAMGLAPALVKAQVPAVIAMQTRVTDRTAIRFSSKFYGLLAQGYPLDTAVAEMRLALLPTGEWGTPVLFMRAPDGILWTGMEAPAATESAPARGGVSFSGISNSQINIGGSVVGGDLTQGR